MSVKDFIQKYFSFLNAYKLPILSGIFIGTSHVPFPPWASLFCFVPLWLFWIQEKSLKKIFVSGWWTQFFLSLIGFSWIFRTLREFGNLPIVPALALFLLFCSLFHFYIPIVGLVWGWIRNRSNGFGFKGFWFLLPAFTVLGEMGAFTLFPWNHAYSWMWVKFPIIQLGDLLGFQGVSAVIVFYNLFFLFIWSSWKSGRKKKNEKKFRFYPYLLFLFVLTSFSYLNYLGHVKKRSLLTPDSSARVLVVQGNLGGSLMKKYGRNYQEYAFRRYRDLTQEALQHYSNLSIDFVVWPEVAMYDIFSSLPQRKEKGWRIKRDGVVEENKSFKKENFLASFLKQFDGQEEEKVKQKKYSLFSYPENKRVQSLREFLKKNQIALIVGAFGKSSMTSSLANGFFLIGRDGENTDTPYFKTQLLAFGEYFPGAQWFPVLKKWFPQVGNYSRGKGPEVKNLGSFKIGPQICYESLFPFFSVQLAHQGAQMIVNITNDSWYGSAQEPHQHLYLAAARAVELRRPLIRVTNTGISTVVLSNGEFLSKSPQNEKWWALYNIPFYKNPKVTFYQRFPYFVHFLIFFYLSILFLFFSFWAYRKKRGVEKGQNGGGEKTSVKRNGEQKRTQTLGENKAVSGDSKKEHKTSKEGRDEQGNKDGEEANKGGHLEKGQDGLKEAAKKENHQGELEEKRVVEDREKEEKEEKEEKGKS